MPEPRFQAAVVIELMPNGVLRRRLFGLRAIATLGAVSGAIGAASCCVVPFVLFSLGIGGAWIANLTALAPYQTYFAGLAVACLGFGFALVYRRRSTVCPEGSYCARPASSRIVKIGLWTATAIVIVALGAPHALRGLLDL